MSRRSLLILAAAVVGLSACKTAPARDSGFITGYQNLEASKRTLRASVREHRDDALARMVRDVYVAPAILTPSAAPGLTTAETSLVLGEIDRQACFELSKRFTLTPAPTPSASWARIAVTSIRRTGAVGSAASAATNAFIPGPIGVRAPGTTGGLAVEAELVDPQGRQVAALAWARNANTIGTDDPSLSRVGDALQFVEPFGDHLGKTFAPKGSKAGKTPDPDPCARFGPRVRPAGFLAGVVTGLYVPQASGVRAQDTATGRPAASAAPRPVAPAAAPATPTPTPTPAAPRVPEARPAP